MIAAASRPSFLRLLGLGLLAAGLLASPAVAVESATAAEAVAFTATFAQMAPGESRTETASVDLPRDATLEALRWERREGLLATGDLDVRVCQARACTSMGSFARIPMSAGAVQVEISFTLPDEALPGSQGEALGVLTFMAEDGELAPTGLGGSATLWGVAALLVGGLLYGLGYHRRLTRTATQ